MRLENEEDTEQFGNVMAQYLQSPMTIYLKGELGSGKTRLSRAILHGLGHTGVVKSPTYTLVEPYQLEQITVYHFDLYRLADASELDFMGIRDYFTDNSVVLVEWPDKGIGFLNPADLSIQLNFAGDGRDCSIQSFSEAGKILVNNLKQNL